MLLKISSTWKGAELLPESLIRSAAEFLDPNKPKISSEESVAILLAPPSKKFKLFVDTNSCVDV